MGYPWYSYDFTIDGTNKVLDVYVDGGWTTATIAEGSYRWDGDSDGAADLGDKLEDALNAIGGLIGSFTVTSATGFLIITYDQDTTTKIDWGTATGNTTVDASLFGFSDAAGDNPHEFTDDGATRSLTSTWVLGNAWWPERYAIDGDGLERNTVVGSIFRTAQAQPHITTFNTWTRFMGVYVYVDSAKIWAYCEGKNRYMSTTSPNTLDDDDPNAALEDNLWSQLTAAGQVYYYDKNELEHGPYYFDGESVDLNQYVELQDKSASGLWRVKIPLVR